MKLIIASVVASFFILGCGLATSVKITAPDIAPPPVSTPRPAPKPTPSTPQPLYSCTGSGSFSKIEVWWTKVNPQVPVYLGELGLCKNSDSNGGLGMSVKYPANGTSITVNGELRTMWMMAKVFDENGRELKFYQHSDFLIRTDYCTQGQFISNNGHILELRVDEPTWGSGEVIFDKATFQLRCHN